MSDTWGKMTPQEERIAGVTVAYLHRCISAGDALLVEILRQPRAGSVAESSLRDKDLLEPILMAGMYLHVAVDHYLTLEAMFIPATVPPGAPEPGVRNYAPYTVVRVALEADAWACWLMDPRLTAIERLARNLTVRALNLRAVRRLDLADQRSDWNYDERIAQVSAVAARYHLKEFRNQEGDLYALGARRPEMVSLLNELLPEPNSGPNAQPLGSRTYGLLSPRSRQSLGRFSQR